MEYIQPIPKGMHTITPYIICRGAADAIEFYKNAFGAAEMSRMHMPNSDKIMHAVIQIGDSQVMLTDEMQGAWSPLSLYGTPVTLHLYVDQVDKVFEQAVRAGAKVTMPVENTFWGDRFGKLEDPFGHSWSVATHVHDMTPEEMEEAMQQSFSVKQR